MQFLCHGTNVEVGPLLPPQQTIEVIENVVNPSLQMIAQWEKEGRARGGIFIGGREGSLILEAGSIEEAHAMISSLPFWGLTTWVVKPLVPFNYVIEQNSKNVERIRNMMTGQ